MARGSAADWVIATGRFTAAWLSTKPTRNEPILPPRGYWPPGMLWMAALLSFGVEVWLFGLHAASLGSFSIWAGDLAHVIRDGLLALPLALLAVGIGARWAERWRASAPPSVRGLFAQAALIAFVFALLLVPAAGPHQLLDRALDGAAHAHTFHGQPRPAGPSEAGDVVHVTLDGLQDALLGYLAALPLMFLGLVLVPGKNQNTGTGVDTVHCAMQATPGRLLVPTAVALALLGAGVAGLSLIGHGVHRAPPGLSPHAAIVTTVAMGSSVEADDLSIVVQSVKWVRQLQAWGKEPLSAPLAQPDAAAVSDRVYLEVTIENVGAALHSVGRGEFRMLAQDGRVWAPLADDFPPILLSPRERLTTRLIFEVRAGAAHLQLVSTVGSAEALIPIADDDLGGFVGSLCRALSKSWKG